MRTARDACPPQRARARQVRQVLRVAYVPGERQVSAIAVEITLRRLH